MSVEHQPGQKINTYSADDVVGLVNNTSYYFMVRSFLVLHLSFAPKSKVQTQKKMKKEIELFFGLQSSVHHQRF